MNDFEMIKNSSLVTTRQEVYPSFADGVQIAAVGANAEGSVTKIVDTATDSVNTLTVTHSCDVAGVVTINLDGINYPVTLATGNIASVATQLRAGSYGAWAVTGTGNDVIFTRSGKRITATFTDTGSTATTASIAVTGSAGVGIGNEFTITSISATAISAVGTYQVTLYKGASGATERIGSVRFAVATAVSGDLPVIPIKVPTLPAGTRISASLASVAGGSETMKISLQYDA